MEYKYGSASCYELPKKFDDLFDTYDCDGMWATKKTYRHSDPGMSFKYKYSLEAVEFEEGKVMTYVKLVMLPESFCKAKRAKLADGYGIEEKDLTVADILANELAGVVMMESQLFEYDTYDEEDWIGCARFRTLQDTVANVLDMLDGMRGFFIDRSQNMIGTTGWDLIKEAKGKIKDAIRASVRRLRKEHKEDK